MAASGVIKTNQDTIRIDGTAGAIKAMQEIGVPTEAIKAANKKTGDIVAKRGRIEVPVRSGALRDSIRSTNLLNRVVVRAGLNRVPYANPIHWGWFRDTKSARAMRTSRKYIQLDIKPNPFLSRALGYTRDEILENYKRNMDIAISGATKRTSGKSQVK
jgi:hypothetical protein